MITAQEEYVIRKLSEGLAEIKDMPQNKPSYFWERFLSILYENDLKNI